MPISTMKKLTVLSYTADTDAIVRKLMNLKCVEIRSTAPKDGLLPLDLMQCDAQKAEAERRIADIRRALPIL